MLPSEAPTELPMKLLTIPTHWMEQVRTAYMKFYTKHRMKLCEESHQAFMSLLIGACMKLYMT